MTELVSTGPVSQQAVSQRPAPQVTSQQAASPLAESQRVASQQAETRRPLRRLGPGPRIPYARLLGPLLLLAAWSIASASGALDPLTLPAPWTVVHTGVERWAHGTLRTDVADSLRRAGQGFAVGLVVGVVLALLAGLSRIGEAVIDGAVQINRSVPTLGLIPLFILWLGIGETFKVAIIAIVVYVPVYLNLHAALAGIDGRYVELAESLGLSRWRFIRKVVIPGALPGFFVGLRLGVTGSWLALVVLEQINATSGLGYMMFQAQNYGQTDVIVLGLLIYGIFGFASDSVVRLVERRVLTWRRSLGS